MAIVTGSISSINGLERTDSSNYPKTDFFSASPYTLICETESDNTYKEISDIKYIDSNETIYLEPGSIIAVEFQNPVRGIKFLTFNFTDSSHTVKFYYGNGNYVTIDNLTVANGSGIFRNDSSTEYFVVRDSDNAVALETYWSNKPSTPSSGQQPWPTLADASFHISTVTVNEKTVGGEGNSIDARKAFTGVKTGCFGITQQETTTTTSGYEIETYSKGMAMEYGWYPVMISGWDSNSRHYRLVTAYLTNVRPLSEKLSGDSAIGYTADLYWKIHNAYSSASAQTLKIYILWMKI